MTTHQTNPENNYSFLSKIWIICGIIALCVIVLLIIKRTFSVFLLILAGSLLAIFFRSISNFIQRKTKWNKNVCVTISIITTLLIITGLFWLIGAKVQSQLVELIDTLPKTIENIKSKFNNTTFGGEVLEKLTSKDAMDQAQEFAGQFFKSTFGVFGDTYVVLFVGIFFAFSPQKYTNGLVKIIPIKGQEKTRQLLTKLDVQLSNWLKGKLFSMFVVFILTAIGLAIIGVPLWLVLALLAGLISFIPNFGPLIALIPAVMVGFMQSPLTAALVAGLYILIQFIESNFITTLVQQKLLNLPPALIIIAQLIMGILTGGWGLVLATPITVIVIVLVQELYIENKNI